MMKECSEELFVYSSHFRVLRSTRLLNSPWQRGSFVTTSIPGWCCLNMIIAFPFLLLFEVISASPDPLGYDAAARRPTLSSPELLDPGSSLAQTALLGLNGSFVSPISPSSQKDRMDQNHSDHSTTKQTLPPRRPTPPAGCPPCFNCLLPAFSCGNAGECSPYDGQCRCPPGFGGQDCLTPRQLVLGGERTVLT